MDKTQSRILFDLIVLQTNLLAKLLVFIYRAVIDDDEEYDEVYSHSVRRINQDWSDLSSELREELKQL